MPLIFGPSQCFLYDLKKKLNILMSNLEFKSHLFVTFVRNICYSGRLDRREVAEYSAATATGDRGVVKSVIAVQLVKFTKKIQKIPKSVVKITKKIFGKHNGIEN